MTLEGKAYLAPGNGRSVNNLSADSDPPDIPKCLSAQDFRRLHVDSGIAPDVIASTGYATVHAPNELLALGFSRNQSQQVPGILIPEYGIDGCPIAPEFRPNNPADPKRKYLTPPKTHNRLIVSTLSLEHLQNPAIPLLFTEGVRKRDSILSHITDDTLVCPISIKGVWGWRGSNKYGGKVAIADFELIALNDRLTYLCFDSDAMTKQEVHGALSRYKAFLESKKAKVRIIYLPHDEDGSKTGADDYLVSGHTLADMLALASDEPRPIDSKTPAKTADGIPYSQNKSGRIEESQANYETMLTHEPEWRGRLRYNEFYQAIELDGAPLTSLNKSLISSWSSHRLGFIANAASVRDRAIEVVAMQEAYDSLMEYLDTLPTWDGVERLSDLFVTYFGSTSSEYTTWCAEMLFSLMIARAKERACTGRYVIVLCGPQDIGKSEAVRAIGGEWTTELSANLDSRDAQIQLKGVWLVELGELNSIRKSHAESVNRFISARWDEYTLKHLNDAVKHPRRAVFVGTTNRDDFLRDPTGSTRWFPVNVTKVEYQKLAQDRDQLFAEALIHYSDHQSDWWKIPPAVDAVLGKTRENNRDVNPLEEDLAKWIKKTKKKSLTWDVIADEFLGMPMERRGDKAKQNTITEALKAIGWTRGDRIRKNGIRVYPWYPPSDVPPDDPPPDDPPPGDVSPASPPRPQSNVPAGDSERF